VPSRLNGILSAGRPVIVAADSESEPAKTVVTAECGITVPPGDPAALAAAFKTSGADVACLCSSDKAYAEYAVAAAKALQAAGAKHIYLAGRPGEQEPALRTAGVGDFIFAGGDALAMLREAWRRMEEA